MSKRKMDAAWALSLPAGVDLSVLGNLTSINQVLLKSEYHKICSLGTCNIVDESHTLDESDVLGEADDPEGKNVYILLNLDGSLPFPGDGTKKKCCEINYPGPWSTTFKHDAQIELIEGYKLATFPVLPLQWKVTFEFKPRNVNVNDFFVFFVNIFQITWCGAQHQCSFRAFYHPNEGLKVEFNDKGGFGSKSFSDPTIGPLLEWTKVEMSQVIECGQVVHRVSINGVKKYREEINAGKTARILTNLDVYTASTGFNVPERGFIKGLSIKIREEPKPLKISRKDL